MFSVLNPEKTHDALQKVCYNQEHFLVSQEDFF